MARSRALHYAGAWPPSKASSAPFTMQTPGNIRFASSSAPSYAEALNKLAQLQSNRTITHLFDKPAGDLNAAAIPEMLAWLRRAGYTPQDLCRMRHIHVAGTKGKGSVCAYATAMLKKYRSGVGTYTSPHLVSPRERIAIDGEPVSQDVFAAAFFEVWDRFSEAARREGMAAGEAAGPVSKPFYFRFLTILAWHIFLSRGVKDVVMECGIGGEYDATNVLPGEAVSSAVVSQLGIDHVAMLGDTVEKIAWHKAGIFKNGTKAFTRHLCSEPDVMEVLRRRASGKGARLVELEDEVVDSWGGVSGCLRGQFQKHNQALAAMAVREHLGMNTDHSTALQDTPEMMLAGLREAKLRGRREEVFDDGGVTWYLDGAHTRDSLDKVAEWLSQVAEENEPVILIFNQQERNACELLTSFLTAVESFGRQHVFLNALFTANNLEKPQSDERRDVSVQEELATAMKKLRPACQIQTCTNLEETVQEARRIASGGGNGTKVLVTGSMHLVGGVLRTLEPHGLL